MAMYVDRETGIIRLRLVPMIGLSEIPMKRLEKFSDSVYDIVNIIIGNDNTDNTSTKISENIEDGITTILGEIYDLDRVICDYDTGTILIHPQGRRRIQYHIEYKK